MIGFNRNKNNKNNNTEDNKNLNNTNKMVDLKEKSEKSVSKGYLMFKKELPELPSLLIPQCKLFQSEDDIMNFKVEYTTEEDSIWFPGKYEFTFSVSDEHPFKAPKVHCKTKVFHPNIDFDGNVCLNILKDDWKPTLSISAVIAGVYFLFYDPNPNDPLNHTAADLMREDITKFKEKVKKTLKGGTIDSETYTKFVN